MSTSIVRAVSLLAVSTVLAAGCEFVRKSTVPSNEPSVVPGTSGGGGGGNSGSMLGTWSSLTNAAITDSSACGSFQWAITSQTSTSVSGTFTAVCLGSTTVSGTASGQVVGSQVQITIAGAANLSGVVCNFTISGTGTLEDNNTALRIPYSGSTCLGPVSGTETLRRPQPNTPPAPTPPPPPSPPPPAAGVACASSHPKEIIACISARYPERLVAHVDLATRQANMAFLRDRIIEAGKCGGLDLGWNLKRGGPELSIDFLAERLNGEVLGIDIAADYDNLSRPLELQWLLGTFPFFLEYPMPTCG